MATLNIRLLGGISLSSENGSAIELSSDKEWGLLAYLVITAGRAQRREVLVGLFWPEKPEENARHSLSQTIYSLRRKLDYPDKPSILLSERHTIELNPDADLYIDVLSFEAAQKACKQHKHDNLSECETCREALVEAAALYRGPFMYGYTLPYCEAFEEWITVQKERLQREAVDMLQQLATCYEAVTELDTALDYAHRWAELVPWQEAAHRRVMRLLALSGRRSDALAYFDKCIRLLKEELNVEPRESTLWLAEDIRTGRIRPVQENVVLASLDIPFSTSERMTSRFPFVERTRQLAEMDRRLRQTIAGEGQILFVEGEAGAGKTTLLRNFATQSHNHHPDLLVFGGQSNAFVGNGDPYLPFRQALSLLTGEVSHGYQTGLLDEAQARRLWEALPLAVQALTDHAPDLIEAFLPGMDLLTRISQAVQGETAWLAALRHQIERSQSRVSRINRTQLQEQTLAFLRALSIRRPLLILLDDLHWIDTDSVSLLFHLARSLDGMRVLIVAAYRQEEVDQGRDGRIHPLKLLLAECKRLFGYGPINLNQITVVEGRAFVEALIDSERNTLGIDFRNALHEHTRGHALFTVEALQEFRTRGTLSWQDEQGWVQQAPANWRIISERAEGVIEARLAHLTPELRRWLAIASVEGNEFSAEMLAQALDQGLNDMVGHLSDVLDRKHNLVEEAGIESIGELKLHQYRFRHSLFQQHLYDGLSQNEKQLWHGRVGRILESMCADETTHMSPRLARHFDLAGDSSRAVKYYMQAGDQARWFYADDQALAAYGRALELADGKQTARILMRIGHTHHANMDYELADRAYAEGFRFWSQVEERSEHSFSGGDHTFRMIWGLGPRNVEPTFDFLPDLFSGLVKQTPDLNVVPDVAHRWEIKEGGLRYIFHLRDDVRWSDGLPVTAHDFACAWQHTRLPDFKLGQPLYEVKGAGCLLDYGIAQDLQRVKVEIPDPYTLVVELSQPAAYFLQLLAHPLAAPKPRHVIERYGDAWATAEHVVCNGPFVLDRWDATADEMYFARNPYYFGDFSGNVSRVEAFYFRQPTTWQEHLALYEQDRLDTIQILNWGREGFETARRHHASEYVQHPVFVTNAFCFDTTRPPFNDVRVRQAFAMTLDKSQYAALSGPGLYRPAHGGYIPPGMPGHSPDIGLPLDPDRARRLLAEAGYPGGRGFPEVVLASFYSSAGEVISRYFVAYWRKCLGVSVTFEMMEWTAYWRYAAEASPHITLMTGGVTYGDPDAFMRQAFRTAQQLTGWHHATYEYLIDKAGRSHDQKERMQIYRQADMLLMQEAPILPYTHQDAAYLFKPRVKHVLYSPMGVNTFWKDIVMED